MLKKTNDIIKSNKSLLNPFIIVGKIIFRINNKNMLANNFIKIFISS